MTEPHDAHVTLARATFRAVGFDLSAMQFPRPPAALAALKAFNGAADDWQAPFAWGYHPNAYCRDFWNKHGRIA